MNDGRPHASAAAPRALFVSNGHGEDVIAARLARELRARRPDLELAALPLVGVGRRYEEAHVEVAGPVRSMPSGGLTMHAWRYLLGDLRAGLVPLTAQQARTLRRARVDVLVVVGDVYAQAMAAGVGARARYVFQSLVSAWSWGGPSRRRYFMERVALPERVLMRRLARRVYARDAATAEQLAALGVSVARWLGNPMVDAAQGPPDPRLRRDGRPLIAVLPGTRGYAASSFRLWWETLGQAPELDAAVAWTEAKPPPGPSWRRASEPERWEAVRGPQRVMLLRDRFGEVLGSADAAVGHAGTAHEQAVARGLPVLTCALDPDYGRRFLRTQARLLGDALTVVEGDAAARVAALRAQLTPERRGAAERVARERMGGPGASARIAEDLLADAVAAGALQPLPKRSE